MKRSQLKLILKECIKELLEEGAFNDVVKEVIAESQDVVPSSTRSESNVPQQTLKETLIEKESENDSQWNHVGNSDPNSRLRDIIRQTTTPMANKTGIPSSKLEEIFMDTAQHTLREQSANGHGGSGMEILGSRRQRSASPEERNADMKQLEALSQGKGINRWAKVAFNQNK